MNNEKQFSEVKRDVTEADVIAWLKKRVIELRADTKTDAAAIQLAVHIDSCGEFSTAYIHAFDECELHTNMSCGECVEQAIANLAGKLSTPEKIAAQKRAAANKLLAEAEAIEGRAA